MQTGAGVVIDRLNLDPAIQKGVVILQIGGAVPIGQPAHGLNIIGAPIEGCRKGRSRRDLHVMRPRLGFLPLAST